ncbi:ABC transporter substrate-binding protein [Aureimonas glaciei]|jgi:dipeptide transport system substrate-binding protein|uniref:ABC transporter substrate-binding protein n=1 Tax=Aureimonas glaciei TaxID=1776957 RepID=A0A916Y2K2_9HYPH|nr:ABC transporter substrate-binding protein [Aureimonas glaciei]GGD27865.1 ABC transporter substrate-binding protein [Aureimonas glaciei]
MKLVSTLLAATALAMAFGSAASAKTLVYCSEGSPEGFDPGLYTAGTTFDASSKPVYNRLTEFKRGTTEVIPGLAESWDVSEDGLEYTFNLRKGVKFQTTEFFTPTRDFNADDVIFSFERQGNKENPYFAYAGDVTWGYYNDMSMPSLVKSFEKIDDNTVKLTLTAPNAPMIANLAMDFASIMSKEYADKLLADGTPEKLNQQPLGTGPFQFVAYQQDAVIRYKAHPDYWGGKQPIDDLVFAITADAAVRLQRLKAGECHVAGYPNPADIPALKADSSVTMMEQPGLNIGYLAYNTTQPPFDKPEVRRALNMAINKDAILEAVYPGIGQIAKNPIPPTMWSYDDSITDDKYDPEAAKAALEAAGVKDLSMKVWAMPVARPYNPNARRMAEMMQADFAKVGVTVEIVTYDWTQYLKLAGDPKHDGAVLAGWTGDNGDPDNFLAILLGCDGVGSGNKAAWCNKDYDALIKKASQISDQTARADLYQQAQVIFKDQAPWATIAHSLVSLPMSTKVSGYLMDPLGSHRFDGVDITE